MHKVFISYHHEADQGYKDRLVDLDANVSFIDRSVADGDVPDNWDAEKIRETIRDDHLRDSTVTIVLAGPSTWRRKHVDWEIYSSMHDGVRNKRSGILVVTLPKVYVPTDYEIERRWEEYRSMDGVTKTMKARWRIWGNHMPWLPDRILDNLAEEDAKIHFCELPDLNRDKLEEQIERAYRTRTKGSFTFRRGLKQHNTEPAPGLVTDRW